MSDPRTIRTLLDAGTGNAPAICGLGRKPLPFSALRALVDNTGAALNELGIGRGSRVAIVLPNGPELAASFLAISCHATAAPLNPAYKREEFEFYLTDLKANALVVERGSDSPAIAAARHFGIRTVELFGDHEQPAGTFRLAAAAERVAESGRGVDTKSGVEVEVDGEGEGEVEVEGEVEGEPATRAGAQPDTTTSAGYTAGGGGLAEPDDIALCLHTSGTTSRPKLVPLSHRNLCASARNVADTLHLDSTDLCLNVMPLFHIHGLMAALLAALGAGGAVCAAPGFDALRFFGWLEAARPTWYTAVPAMHQAILRRAPRNRCTLDKARLRFIRSASSPLPRQVFAELETTLGVPVIEAYAMTEAAHQMTSSPLPPGQRFAGTVGRATGPEVAIMDETSDRLLGANETGEVVVRGANVFSGYENNPQANANAFAGGWFRTGDQAVMDSRGYLTITGRLKEIINRGGEKISPREVDDVLLDHPAVSQAVTFALPHPVLGEEVAAAVVLRDGTGSAAGTVAGSAPGLVTGSTAGSAAGSAAESAEDAIRGFAAARLAAFKVPRKVVVVEEIPKGATGKLQRIGLAAKLGLA